MQLKRPRKQAAGLAVAGALALASAAWGHAPVDASISELDVAIAERPGEAELYLQRAELQRTLRDYPRALADLQRAEQLGAEAGHVDLHRGRALLEAERAEEALAPLARALVADPQDALAWLLRGRALFAAGRHAEAVSAFSGAIAAQTAPAPGLFLERSRAAAAGGDGDAALRSLDEGIARLGPLVTLEQPAIELERQRGAHEAALRRLARIARQSPRQERWLLLRAEILAEAGRPGEARRALHQAQAALATLPAARRETRAVAALAQQIERELQKLAPPSKLTGDAPS